MFLIWAAFKGTTPLNGCGHQGGFDAPTTARRVPTTGVPCGSMHVEESEHPEGARTTKMGRGRRLGMNRPLAMREGAFRPLVRAPQRPAGPFFRCPSLVPIMVVFTLAPWPGTASAFLEGAP